MNQNTVDLRRLAALSMLEFDEKEEQALRRDMEAIVRFAGSMQSETDEGGETFRDRALIHAQPVTQAARPDEPAAPLEREKLLANAPDASDGFFVVPRVVE